MLSRRDGKKIPNECRTWLKSPKQSIFTELFAWFSISSKKNQKNSCLPSKIPKLKKTKKAASSILLWKKIIKKYE